MTAPHSDALVFFGALLSAGSLVGPAKHSGATAQTLATGGSSYLSFGQGPGAATALPTTSVAVAYEPDRSVLPLAEPTVVEFDNNIFVDSVPSRRGPLAWRPDPSFHELGRRQKLLLTLIL